MFITSYLSTYSTPRLNLWLIAERHEDAYGQSTSMLYLSNSFQVIYMPHGGGVTFLHLSSPLRFILDNFFKNIALLLYLQIQKLELQLCVYFK